ncbi:7326_t:CDS:1, partial [Paraglomus brasilianum]
WMFDDYAELRPLKEVAQLLAQYSNWGPLYDVEQLGKNNVPVAGARICK